MWKYIGVKECNEFLHSLYLLDISDSSLYINTIYSISNRIKNNYKIYKIPKKTGGYRTIYEPLPYLKQIQKRILENILNNKSISKYAKAYHPGISMRDNAVSHVGKKVVLKLDILGFFEHISFLDVYQACFPIEYFPKSIGMLLTNLCCYDGHLTQGSPTSAYISNLVMKEFDEEIGEWCLKKQIDYTRYSDDMTFSGDFNPKEVIVQVRTLLKPLGLSLNNKKTKVVLSSSSQTVTGIVVNEKIQVPLKYRKQIRLELYYISKFGLDSHMKHSNIRMSPKKYLNSLYGKILYVLQIDPLNREFLEYKQIVLDLKNNLVY